MIILYNYWRGREREGGKEGEREREGGRGREGEGGRRERERERKREGEREREGIIEVHVYSSFYLLFKCISNISQTSS